MYIRKKSKNIKDKEYIQYQIIESYRTSKGPRQNVVLNLGIEFDLHEDKWRDLIKAIEDILSNQTELDISGIKKDTKIEMLAQHYARLIVAEKLNKEVEITEKIKEKSEKKEIKTQKDLQLIDIKSMANSDSRSIGVEHLIVEEMKKFEIDDILKELEFSEREIIETKMLITGRAAHPSSELETSRWINNDSGIQELIGSDIKVYDTSLHRTGKKIWEKKEELEKKLTEKTRSLFSLKETIILYDLTNTYFEGKYENAIGLKYGRSKEKRNDCKLATLALVVDEHGFPKQSKILPGNIGESGTLKEFLSEINKMGNDKEVKTIVIDAGIASEENLKLIKDNNLKYVAISRKNDYDAKYWENAPEKTIKVNKGKTELSLKLHKTENESFLLCNSSDKAKRDEDIISSRLNKFENDLTAMNEGLKKTKTVKQYSKINERIGRIKERYGVGHLYDIEVNKNGDIATEIKFKRNDKCDTVIKGFGEYVIRTNRMDLDGEEISKIHRSLTRIEDAFRIMKSELGVRPNFHKNEDAAYTHIFISVLTYYFINSILVKLGEAGCNYIWSTIRNILSTHDRITTSFNNEKNETIYIRNTVTPNKDQKNIYNFLGIQNILNKRKYVHV